jgi:hypothetical protein
VVSPRAPEEIVRLLLHSGASMRALNFTVRRHLYYFSDNSMPRSRFRAWVSTLFTGHVVLFQDDFAIPIAILALLLNYAEGTLTLAWAGEARRRSTSSLDDY